MSKRTIGLAAGFVTFLSLAALAQPGPGRGRGAGPGPGPGMDMGMGMLRMMDTDGDGKVSREESMKAHRERFDQLDANKDGFIGRDELPAPGGGPGPGGQPGGPGADGGPGSGPAAGWV